MKVLIKYLVLPIFLFFLFNTLEYGFQWSRVEKFVYPAILTALTLTILLKPKLKKLFLFSSLLLLLLMIFLYLMDEIILANTIGSFGFAVLIIVIIFYLPMIIRIGYIEKF